MPDCSEIQHLAGYDPATGRWIEEYFYQRSDGQVFVFLRNDPPEGQKSQTPPGQVGLENGFCTVSEPAEVVEGLEPTAETAVAPRSPEVGGMGLLAIAAVAIAIAGAVALAKNRESQKQSRYDSYINQQKPFQPAPSSVSDEQERRLIGEQLYHQDPVDTALKNIWDVQKTDPEYQKKRAFYLKVREQYESQYPNAKFEDHTA